MKKLGYKKIYKKQYNPIEYQEPGTPEENSKAHLKAVTIGHQWLQGRTTKDYELMGMFFSIVLLIEFKLNDLLLKFDPEIEDRTFGVKIDVYKDFIKNYITCEGEDINEYKSVIESLKKIKDIRNGMAHDISKFRISLNDIKVIEKYIKKRRPDLYESVKNCEDENVKVIGVVSVFGFVFSTIIGNIRHQLI